MKLHKAVIATVGAAMLSTGLATGVATSAHGIDSIGKVTDNCRDNRVNNNGTDAIYGRVRNQTNCNFRYRFRIG